MVDNHINFARGCKKAREPGRSTTTLGRNIDRTEWNTEPTEPIFGRTDLRKGVSEAKFDVEADFDVKKSLAPPKSAENHEKPKTNPEIFSPKHFFGVKKSKVANRPKRVFPKFRGDPSEVPNRPNRSTRSSDRATDRTDRRPPC